MNNKIDITISSLFKGEGFKKATTAATKLGGEVKKAGGLVGQLGGAFGGLAGSAGKAAGAIGGLSTALAGGALTATIAALTVIVSKIVKWREEAEETRKANEKFAENQMSVLKKLADEALENARKAQIKFFDAIIDGGDKAIAKLNAVAAAYAGIQKAQSSLDNAKTNKEIAKIDAETSRRINEKKSTTGIDQYEEGVIKAEGELKKQQLLLDKAKKQGDDAIAAAVKRQNANAKALEAANEAVAAAKTQRGAVIAQYKKDILEAQNEMNEGEDVARNLEADGKKLSPQYNEAAKKYWAARERLEKLQEESAEKEKAMNEKLAKAEQTREKLANEAVIADKELQAAKENRDAAQTVAETQLKEATQKLAEARNLEANKFKVPAKPVANGANGVAGNGLAAGGNGVAAAKPANNGAKPFNEQLKYAVKGGMLVESQVSSGYQYKIGENGLPMTKKDRDRALRYAKRNERYRNSHKGMFSDNPFGGDTNEQHLRMTVDQIQATLKAFVDKNSVK